MGYVHVTAGTITVVSTEGDAISAQTDLLVTGGTFMLTSGGGSSIPLDEHVSTKGLKSGVSIIVEDGTFAVSSSDDSVHTNGVLVINGGTFDVSSADDGMLADISLTIDDGTIDVSNLAKVLSVKGCVDQIFSVR